MKTKEDVLKAIKSKEITSTLDGRDFYRLIDWFGPDYLELFELRLADGATWDTPIKPWTEEAFKEQLRDDLAFAFEKALDQRGISAGLMRDVVKLWLWVLDVELDEADDGDYAQYGLPLLKATAVHFGFPNPIGDDRGDEHKYSASYGYDD